MKFRFFSFIFLIVCWFLSFQQVKAFSLDPAKQTLVVEAGHKKEILIKVINDSNVKHIYYPSVDSFTIDEYNNLFFNQNDEAENWLTVVPDKLVLTPGQTGEFVFNVDVPEQIKLEKLGHYLVFFVDEDEYLNNKQKSNVGLKSRLGSLVFLYVKGKMNEQMQIIDWGLKRKILFKKPQEFLLKLKNIGNVHYQPTGEIKLFYKNKIQQTWFVNSRQQKVLPSGLYSETFNLNTNKFKWYKFGKWELQLKLVYGLSKQKIYMNYIFYYFPPVIIVLGLFILSLFGFLMFYVKKRF